MEYLAHDGQNLHKIYITKKFIDIESLSGSLRYPVDNVSLFTENEGKLQTTENIIRYTKGTLYLYDTKHNLLRVYLFSKKYSKEPELDFGVYNTTENSDILQDRFSLKPGVVLELYKSESLWDSSFNKREASIESGNYYIKKVTVSSTGVEFKTIQVKSVYGVGESIVYLTEQGDKLQVSKKYRCTYNGCPIGKFQNVI